MSIQFLWAALSAACVTATPPVYDDEITNAIAMIATELTVRHSEGSCWEPKERSGGWLTKYEGATTALTTLALLNQTAWGVHGYGPKFAVHLLDTLLEE